MVEARVNEHSGGWRIPSGVIRLATGVVERRYAPDGVCSSDLATWAAQRALRAAGIEPVDIDLLDLRVGLPRRRRARHGQHGPGRARLRPRRGDGREERVQQLPQRARRRAGVHRDRPRHARSWWPRASGCRRPSSGTSAAPRPCRPASPRSRSAMRARRAWSRRAPTPSVDSDRGVRVGRPPLGALDRARRRLPLRRRAGADVLRVPEHEAAAARDPRRSRSSSTTCSSSSTGTSTTSRSSCPTR